MEEKISLKKFTLYYIAYSLILAGTAILVATLFSGKDVLVPQFWLIFGFLGGLTFIAYILVYLGMKRNPETAIMAIMGSIAVKMFFSLAFVLIYSLKSQGNAFIFVANFFSLYFLFSFFEIYCLLRNLRHQNK